MFAAMVQGDSAVLIWLVAGTLIVLALGWMFYLMTFRTEVWLQLVKDEQERKAKRQERTDKVLKGAFTVAKWWLKK
jgi:hypothetical protein